MATDKGFPSKDRETGDRVHSDHITAEPVREKQYAKSVVSHQYTYEVGTDAVEAGSTTTVINLTAHVMKVGDILRFTSGNLSGQEVKVLKTDTDTVEVAEILSEAPAAADAIQILRHKYPVVNADGTIAVSAASAAIEFRRDGSLQEVVEDTITPSNNRPLPVKLSSVTGDINITANDLHVALEHTNDSVRLGDGTNLTSVSAIGELAVEDADTHTKLDSLLTELQAKADLTETQPVSVASLPLPTGAATEATLSSIDGKDFATQTTLAALLTELQAKADLTETQPVSVASLPLPTGSATEATLSSIDGKDFATQTTLSSLEGKDFATQTTLASLEGKDFATQTTLAAQAADIGTLEDRLAGALIPEAHDYIALTYVAAGNGAGEIETVTYKTGGAGGSTVGTLTLGYDGSDRLSTITKS